MTESIFHRIHAEKYRGPGESFREWSSRVANALKDDDTHFFLFRDMLQDQRFLPGGRVQAAMGSPRMVTAYNCFVAPTIDDSFTDGQNSIMGVAAQAAKTMRMGGGIGYDFSSLRPRGSLISTLGSHSSGPVMFMSIFDAVCRATSSAGNRRGAQMGVMRIDHPDIEEFIEAKQNSSNLTGFNISIAVTDSFMKALIAGEPFPLEWGGRRFGMLDSTALWEKIMRSTWDWAEPGVLFVDTINRMNNLYYCETIAATNPCGEQPLPPHGACLLGSFNLTKYVRRVVKDYKAGLPDFDWQRFHNDIGVAVRAMDNVVDRTTYPLPEQKDEAWRKRRMGLGVTGLANTLEALGATYGSDAFLDGERMILTMLRDESYRTSAIISRDKGWFSEFRKEPYLDGEFVRDLPAHVRDLIAEYGIRNSHLTSIAPTGTISLSAGNVSSGIEPVFSYTTQRRILTSAGPETHTIKDYGVETFATFGKVAEQCTVDDHLNVLAVAQSCVDSAVSKTINVDPETKWSDFKNIYMRAWSYDCKGVTTFNPSGKRMGILAAVSESGDDIPRSEEAIACYIDPTTGERSCE